MPKLILEISCPSAGDAYAAQQAGADRIELCSALFLGGLTPSAGAIRQASAELKIPFEVMIRPRPGDSCYSQSEFETMERDVDFALQHGAAGVVLGIVQKSGVIDMARCKRLKALAGGSDVIFHRAFDIVPDPLRGLEELIDLGFTRILTSGQQPTALGGAELIRRLIDASRGRIEILPAGSVRPGNVKELVRRTGCTQVHLAPLKRISGYSPPEKPQICFGSPEAPPDHEHQLVDTAVVEEMARVLRNLDQC